MPYGGRFTPYPSRLAKKMKFSENWLRTYVDPELDSDELAHALTMAGLEVEALESVAPPFEKVVVAEVLALEKHPNADRLNVCQVSIGGGSPLQIVCGAANVHAGARVPCALVGAKLPGMEIRQAKVRGVESFGMLCSAKELGLAEESEGLLLLPADAPVGSDIRVYLDLDDRLFTLKLTPNRSDCLSVTGIAREVAAVTATSLTLPEAGSAAIGHADRLAVTVADAVACPRYCGRIVHGVDMGAATPEWMTRRLERSGLRSINAVVDVTNYVLLELGQPLHAFDLAKISGDIVVRFAKAGEQLMLLNQQAAALDADMLVIADAEKALALAGIMGGAESAVSGATADIFFEAAFFSPAAMAGRARRLGLSTDSSYRFERGVDFAATRDALERATVLLQQICGGTAGEITETMGRLPQREPIQLRTARARRVLGIELSDETVEALLRRLQFVFAEQAETYFVTPPSYRFDLTLEADLIEELARLYGYDRIPALPPQSGLKLLPESETARDGNALRDLLAARDYQEIVSYSFVDSAWERDLAGNAHPVQLKNPIASHMGVMRSTLFGGLLDSLRFNLNRKQERVRLFEIGRCFGRAGEGYVQPARIAGLCYGLARPEQWGEAARSVDFYDVKADVESLCHPTTPVFRAAAHPALHPGQSVEVRLNGERIGWIGTLHPRLQQQYDLAGGAVLFELELGPLLQRALPCFAGVSKFPPVRRDIAVVVDEALAVRDMLDAMREDLPAVVTDLAPFDMYRGKGIDLGKKSLAFRVLMQDTQKTLTDEEADAIIARLTQVLASRFDAKLRA